MPLKTVKRLLAALLALLVLLPLLVVVAAALFGWNWARAPLQRAVLARTGRVLVIAGDLQVRLGWPALHVLAQRVTFANPSWAAQPQMLTLQAVDAAMDLRALWQRQLMFSSVHLNQPVVMLETAPDGRKTWLLDLQQSDASARVLVQRVTLDSGTLGYDDKRLDTMLRVAMDTTEPGTETGATAGIGTATLDRQLHRLRERGEGQPRAYTVLRIRGGEERIDGEQLRAEVVVCEKVDVGLRVLLPLG